MFTSELKRAFLGYPFWISLLIGILISCAHIFVTVIPEYQLSLQFPSFMPDSAFGRWIGAWGTSPLTYLFYFVCPFLATAPYGWSLYSDFKNGYAKQIFTRTSKFNYLTSKTLAVFLSGGAVCTVPVILDFLGCACILPLIQPDPISIGDVMIYPYDWCADLYFSNILLYTIMYWGITFAATGMLACSALAFGCMLPNQALTTLSPFIVCTILSQVFTSTGLYSLIPTNFIHAGQLAGALIPEHVLFFFIVTSLLVFILLAKTTKEDFFA